MCRLLRHLARRASLLAALGCVLVSAVFAAEAQPRKPSILYCSPQGAAGGWIDLQYAADLAAKGFEVDYTERLEDAVWERVKDYNVLVIYVTPDAWDVTMRAQKSSPEKAKAFADLVDKYAAAGGGVLLLPTEMNVRKQQVAELTDRFGAKLPVEIIEETDKQKLGYLVGSSHQSPLAWTDQVPASPVSEGVKQVWYPVSHAYNAQHTGPVAVDGNWQVVLKASKTSLTKPVDLAKSTMPELENPFSRPGGVKEPDLAAIRPYRSGRVALVNQWRQHTVGSGTRFIFDRQVLSKGFEGRPSDMGRLLENLYRWLAGPSLRSGAVGGYAMPAGRLEPPNQSPEVRRQYAERFWPYDAARLGEAGLPGGTRLFRGLIGAKTSLSSGRGNVEDYAKAAGEAGLDFLVFMEDFDKLTPERLQGLAADCKRLSGDKLLLLPGFTIRNNVGNRMFFFSPEPEWVPDYCLCGPDKKTLYVQEEDGKGGFTGYITPFLDWVLGAYHVEKGQVGYFDFSGSPRGMRMYTLRLYAMAAVRCYKDGRLVEDRTDDYLTTAQGTIPPAPVSVNEVASPEELSREVKAGHALTFAQARSAGTLFMDALRWTHQYDGPNVSCSDGPRVLAWPGCHRVHTLGAEDYVTGLAVMPSPLAVASDKGLKEVRIYNGRELFRRFLPGGAKEFRQTLVLDGTVQKDLVLVAEDVAGGRAITFARRNWKDGALAPVYCSDHVNDGTMALAHGPYSYPVIRQPFLPVDVAGETWDGGPLACLSLVGNQNTVPVVDCDQGREDGGRFDQTPVLEFSDEGAMAVSSPRDEVFEDRVKTVVNPWHTYGPVAGPSKLFRYVQRYREFTPPSVGVPETGWAGPGVRMGTNASIFRNEITWRQDLKLKSLQLGYFPGSNKAVLVIGAGGTVREIDLGQPGKVESFKLSRGDWLGYYSRKPANSNLFFVRGEPMLVEVRAPYVFFRADCDGSEVKHGQTHAYEMSAIGLPLNVPIAGAADLGRYLACLRAPAGMKLVRGKRLERPGLLELAVDDRMAVELSIPKPQDAPGLTLPCRIEGFHRRWSAGLFQVQGYNKGDYGSGERRYRALGLDFEGHAYVPLYVDRAPVTHVVAGHPVIAGPEGRELFIQVTKVGVNPDRWHVAVNNPTDQAITTTLKRAMDLPGLDFADSAVTIAPGGYVVLR